VPPGLSKNTIYYAGVVATDTMILFSDPGCTTPVAITGTGSNVKFEIVPRVLSNGDVVQIGGTVGGVDTTKVYFVVKSANSSTFQLYSSIDNNGNGVGSAVDITSFGQNATYTVLQWACTVNTSTDTFSRNTIDFPLTPGSVEEVTVFGTNLDSTKIYYAVATGTTFKLYAASIATET